MKTMQQEMAEKAYTKVADFGKINAKGSPERNQYGGMAHKLPILVRTAGLAEALAFVESRGKTAHLDLLEDLAQVAAGINRTDFCAQSRETELQSYIFLTRQTMLALKWFKRFSQSVLDVDATQDEAGVTS